MPLAQAQRHKRQNSLQQKGWREFCRFRFFQLILWTPCFVLASPPEIMELQALNFGVLALTSNIAPSHLVVSPQGNATYGANLISIGPPTPGRYRLSGYPPHTSMSASLNPANLALRGTGPGEQLSISSASTNPVLLFTDHNGVVEFSLGATLSTSGNGLFYGDGPYLGRSILVLNFEYNSETVQSYQYIDAAVELRSALELTQIDSLSFGQIAVFSSNTAQATISLTPSGQIGISNTPSARVIRFGGERPGRFRVSSGAAYASVTVNLPTETIYLIHSSQSPFVARLLVENFAFQPNSSGTLKLDSTGTAEFRIGASLSTEQTAKPYQDGVYRGIFPLTVEY